MILAPPTQYDVELDADDGGGPLLGGAPPRGARPAPRPRPLPPLSILQARPAVSLGVDARPITPETVDQPALAAEIRAQADAYSFSILDIRATIRPREDAMVETLALGVTLELLEFALDPPVAWSLSPQRLVAVRKSPFKVDGSIEVSFVAGVKLGVSYEPGDKESWWLLATGELQPNPDWSLRTRPTIDLAGDHPLLMVIRHPVGIRCRALLAMTCTTRAGGFLSDRRVSLPPEVRAVTLHA